MRKGGITVADSPETKSETKENNLESESCFGAFCDSCTDAFRNGAVGNVLTDYSREERAFESSAIATVVRRSDQGHGLLRKLRRAVARSFEESFIMGVLEKLKGAVLACSAKTIGVFFVTFGIYSSLIYLIKKYALYTDGMDLSDLVCGIAMIITSFPLLFSSKTVAEALCRSVFMKPVFSDALGIEPEKMVGKKKTTENGQSWAVIVGIAIGMLTYYIPPIAFIAVFFCSAFLAVLMTYPESGVMILMLLAPFFSLSSHPSLILAVITLLSAAGFTVKYLRGKRIVSFGPSEAAVAAFMLLTLAGGLFVPGGKSTALMRSVLILIYFLIVNTVNTRQRLNTCVSLFIGSATIISFIGIAEYLLGKAVYDWLDVDMFSEISGRSTSLFSNPNTLGYFIILAFPFALAAVVLGRNKRERFISGFCALSMLLCAVFTWSRGAWIGLAASSILFMLILTPRSIAAIPAITAAGSLLCIVFPGTLGARIDSIASLADSANYYRIRIWNGVCRIIGKYAAGGIGVGEEIFSRAYMRMAAPEVWNASHAHSLWLQTLTELGIPGLLMLVLAVFLLVQKSMECIKLCPDKKLSLLCGAGICGVMAVAVSGFFDFVWYNYTVFFAFWAVAGIASASAQIRKREVYFVSVENISNHSDERSADMMIYLGRDI